MSTYETVQIRPITFAEIEALAQPDAGPVQVYLAEESRRHGLTFTPATLTPDPRPGKARRAAPVSHQVMHACVEDTRRGSTRKWRTDPDVVVGYAVAVEIKTIFGIQTDGHLFTSPEAEHTALMVHGWRRPSDARTSLYVEDDQAGQEERVTPTHGAQVSTGFVVTGIDAEEARLRAEQALRAEFGDALRPHWKVQSRPVMDRRVNVFTTVDREPVALNILHAEISYVMRTSSVHVEEVDPEAPPVTVGT